MINQKLVGYIQQNLNAGYDVNAMRRSLVNSGYPPNDVEDTINYVYSQKGQIKGGVKMAKMDKLEYGGFWIRFSAMVWDGIILGIPAWILQVILVLITGISSMMYLVSLAVVVITIYMDGIKGGTPGKLILGLRIKNEKGEYIGIPMAILRYIGKILSGLILGIGYLMIAWDKRKQGLHDKIASTFVVKTAERKGLFIVGLILGVLPLLLLPFLVVIGSMAYFGVLQPDKFLPSKCAMPSGIMCFDFQTRADGTTQIGLRNSMGRDLTSVSVVLENECTPKQVEWKSGETLTFTCVGKKGKIGERYEQDIVVKYTIAETGIPHTVQGSLLTKYE